MSPEKTQMNARRIKKLYPNVPRPCTKCKLFLGCNKPWIGMRLFRDSSYEGPVPKKVCLLVGMYPEESEDRSGEAFSGKSGEILKKYVKKYLDGCRVYVTNAIRCKPSKDEKIDMNRIKLCSEFLKDEIDKIKPDVIVGMGDTAHKALDFLRLDYVKTLNPAIEVYSEDRKVEVENGFIRVSGVVDGLLEHINVSSWDCVEEILRKPCVALDLEWDSSHRVHTVGFSDGNKCVANDVDTAKQALVKLVKDRSKIVVGHNIVSDIVELLRMGIVPECSFIDTIVLQRVLAPFLHDLSLDEWCEKYLMIENYWKHIKDYENTTHELIEYCARDAYVAYKLMEYLESTFKHEVREAQEAILIDRKMILPTAYMMFHGIGLDEDRVLYHHERLLNMASAMEERIRRVYGINPRSYNDVLEKLSEENEEIESTDRATLSRLNSKLAKEILEYRKIYTLYSRYIKNLKNFVRDGRIHASIKLSGASTGRPACTNPNLLNVEPSVRDMFMSTYGDDGILLSCDKNQAEFRILGYLSQSNAILDAYRSGKDFHTLTSNLCNIDRKTAKILNFSYVYGSSRDGLVNTLIEAGVKDALQVVDVYLYTMKSLGIENYQKSLIDESNRKGYVSSPLGRRGYRLNTTQIVNYPIQSFASDMNKLSIIYLFNRFREENICGHIWLDFYDSIEIDIYKPELDKVLKLIDEIPTEIPYDIKPHKVSLPHEVKQHGRNWS